MMPTKILVLAMALLIAAAPAAVADCPDAGVRCRIALTDAATMGATTGCSVNGEAGVVGDVPSVTIGGSCYYQDTETDSAGFYVAGTLSMGQCYDLFQGGCQPDHCGTTMNDRCNEQIPVCTTGCLDQVPDCAGWGAAGYCDPSYTIDLGLGAGPIQVDLACPQTCGTCAAYFGRCEGLKISGRRLTHGVARRPIAHVL
ncbi:hypothetical protein JKP88DRAFT_24967 [Tribonema minus]|uniref:Uncharacterized protein n=1 Tax=Tribonema minus TaxID=303371 RepID=A0A835Z876_9STRA|nr:hypothetical protein JKP88DRAFT_24967 [Tribonema minus]